MGQALGAIAGGVGDLFGRLGWLALLCLVGATAASVALAWAGLTTLLPLIPEGEGLLAYVWTTAEALAGVGLVLLAILVAPAVSMIIGGALFDVAAERVERAIAAPPGRAIAVHEGLIYGLKLGVPALTLNVFMIPLYFIPIIGIVLFFWVNGYLMGREYAALAAARRMSWREARRWRQRHPLAVFSVGLACSFVPLVAPLVGASAMTRLLNRLGPS